MVKSNCKWFKFVFSGCKRKIDLTVTDLDVTNGDIRSIREERGIRLKGTEILDVIAKERSDKDSKLSYTDHDVRLINNAVSNDSNVRSLPGAGIMRSL